MLRRPAFGFRGLTEPTAGPKPLGVRHLLTLAPCTRWLLSALGGVLLVGLAWVWIRALVSRSPTRLRADAESAVRAGDWNAALHFWRALNATDAARANTYLEEARTCLALSRAAQAERSLRRAIAADPADPKSWYLLLEILQVEDRTLEAQELGWQAYARIHPAERRTLLRTMTFFLLSDVSDELVRSILRRWIDADNTDIDAQIALWERIAAQPRASDPDRPAILAALELLLGGHPTHTGARAALVAALADAGDPDRGRALLDEWPVATRDARYWRLYGRWELEYEHRPDQAVTPFRKALSVIPQDWRSWYRLARALHILGRDVESRQAAETVSRIREVLDPLTLGARLDAAFNHLDDPAALQDLATLCDRAGLTRLANAWHAELGVQAQPTTLFIP